MGYLTYIILFVIPLPVFALPHSPETLTQLGERGMEGEGQGINLKYKQGG